MSGQFDKYFYDVTLDCPYGLSCKSIYRQAQFAFIPDSLLKFFIENGFRRNGNYIYTMVCDDCDACLPIRIDPVTFERNRNQRRIWKKNQDLDVRISPLQINNEKLAICDKFLESRFPDKGNSALDYYAGFFVNTLDCTYEVEMWEGDYLIGVSIIDVIEDVVNCVYFYFDPAAGKRSPGTFNILYLIDYALKTEFKQVYLGYYINGVSSMAYKANFKPHSLLLDGAWQKISENNK